MSDSVATDTNDEPEVKPKRTTRRRTTTKTTGTAAKTSTRRKKAEVSEEPKSAAEKPAADKAKEDGEKKAPAKRATSRSKATKTTTSRTSTSKAASKKEEAKEEAQEEVKAENQKPEVTEKNETVKEDLTERKSTPRRRTRTVTTKEEVKTDSKEESKSEDSSSVSETTGSQSEPAQNSSKSQRSTSRSSHSKQSNSHSRQNNSRNQRQSNSNNNSNNNNNKRRPRRQRNNNREVTPTITREELEAMKVVDLRKKAQELEIETKGLRKQELIDAVFSASAKAEGFTTVTGVLDVLSEGYGFLRTQGYLPSETDCYVGHAVIKRNALRKGDHIEAQTRPTRDNEKYPAIQKIITVNGKPVEECRGRVRFSDLTPVYPQERLWMEHGKNTTTARVIDLVAPIGKGQRGLIVSPPKAGKTTILKDIAASISANNPEVHLMCLLIDERPEEVTDMQRSVKGEVIASTFDMPADNHIAVSEMVIERAKRLVEGGEDVVILLDSITRLARAYNLAQPASGRVLSGGVDSTALYPPKKFLGAARNIENGGSLTILASALIETGSKMDEVIFEEFKGTGNMELRLDRSLADRRIFPAIDAVASGTRKEELLIDSQVAPLIWAVRRVLANMNNTERATGMLIKSVKMTETNQEFLLRTARKAQQGKGDIFEL